MALFPLRKVTGIIQAHVVWGSEGTWTFRDFSFLMHTGWKRSLRLMGEEMRGFFIHVIRHHRSISGMAVLQ